MTINILKTSDDTRNLIKNFDIIATGVSIVPKNSFDVLTPTIILAYNAAYLPANYFYIPDVGKYYFLSRPILQTGKEIQLELSLDSIMTYADYLKNCPVTVTRSEATGTTYVVDQQLPIDSNRVFFEGILFPNQPIDNADDNYQNYNYVVGVNT